MHAAALGNVLEMDDLAKTALLHPGPVIVPTALFAAQHVTLGTALDAVVQGYEAMIRLGQSLDAFHYARWHPSTTAGIPAAAVAAAAVQGLSETHMRTALANALSVSGGLWHMRHGSSLTKQFHIVHAVRSGIDAAHSAVMGMSGADTIIEGAQGWHAVLADTPKPDAIEIHHSDWLIFETSFKPWPACRHCHPSIDAAMALGVAVDQIVRIEIETYKDALTFCDKPNPATPAEARFSLQHCVAVALLKGVTHPSDFELNMLDLPSVAGLRARTSVIENPHITQNYPIHFGGRVTVHLKSGEVVEDTVSDALGDPEQPLSFDQVRRKYDMLSGWGLDDVTAATQLANAILHAPENTPLSEILELAS